MSVDSPTEITILGEPHQLGLGWLLMFSHQEGQDFASYLSEPEEGVEGGRYVCHGTGRDRAESLVDLWLALAVDDAKLPACVVESLLTHVDMAVAAMSYKMEAAPIDPASEAH